jgi:hypothetical protein
MTGLQMAARVLIITGFFATVSCSSDHLGQPPFSSDAFLHATFLTSSIAEEITSVSLEISQDSVVVFDEVAEVEDGNFDFGVISLSVGEASFSLEASNSAGVVTYAGDTTLVVEGGVQTDLEMELLPSIPMIKLSPYHANIGLNDRFSCTLELFNIEKFFNGSFKIAYDPNHVSFDSTVSQIDTAWGELVLFARDIGDTVVVSVSRTQGNSDDVPLGSHSLVSLEFRARASGNTTLELFGDRVEDFNGTIREIEEVHFDNQMLAIQ